MMYWISKKSGEILTINQLQYCLMRNFGGGPTDINIPELFLRKVEINFLSTRPPSTSYVEVSS